MSASTYLNCKTEALEYTHQIQEIIEDLRRKSDNIVKCLLSSAGDDDIDARCEARKMQILILELTSVSISQVQKLEML